jgi:hypothetical protein
MGTEINPDPRNGRHRFLVAGIPAKRIFISPKEVISTMKTITLTTASLVLFLFAASGAVMAGNMNPNGGTAALSADEEAGLIYMREEEKLARDVYQALFAKWGLRVFEKIASSEQQHMDAVLYLLGKYGLDDPASEQPGIFQNEDLQILYDNLVAQGEDSVLAAIEVGIYIEETDITDITSWRDLTDNPDIYRVYTNLLEGSYRHLAAFESHL